jgi:hypothetical protein
VNLAILTGDQIPVRSLLNTTGGKTAFFNGFREQVAIVFNYVGVWRTTPDTCEDGFSARPPEGAGAVFVWSDGTHFKKAVLGFVGASTIGLGPLQVLAV